MIRVARNRDAGVTLEQIALAHRQFPADVLVDLLVDGPGVVERPSVLVGVAFDVEFAMSTRLLAGWHNRSMAITHDLLPATAFDTEAGEELRQWSTSRLLALFATLNAPGAFELDGEYSSALPVDRDVKVREWFSDIGSGHWLGKAYRPGHDGEVGEGHNLWRKDSCDERTSRFAWEIGPSTIGDGESLVMRYAAFRNYSGELDLIDEVRRVRDGLYVGVYHTPMVVDPFTRTLRSDGQRTEPEVFLLAGPIGEWQGPDDPDLELLD